MSPRGHKTGGGVPSAYVPPHEKGTYENYISQNDHPQYVYLVTKLRVWSGRLHFSPD